MPASITHMLIARAACKGCRDEDIKRLLLDNFHSYLWGAQGPDLLMHGGYWPWHKLSNLVMIGIRLHKDQINETFCEMREYLNERRGKSEYGPLAAYVLGYITHHSADALFHPFVYGMIERQKSLRPRALKNSVHYNIEENIDVALLHWLYGESPYRFTAYNALYLMDEICLPVSSMYSHILGTRFGRRVSPKEIVNAFKDMRMLQRFLFDPYGFKCSIVTFLEDLTGNDLGFSYITHRQRLDTRFDYCNFSKRLWANPFDGGVQSDDDVFDLYKKALNDSIYKIESFNRILSDGGGHSEVCALFGEISFNTGQPDDGKQG